MVTRRYGMSSTASDILKRHKENACITNYIRVKNEIVQKINELQKKEPRQFCSKCDTIKKLIIAENEKVNNCYLRNSKSFKLIEDDDIKDFIEECIDFRTCFHNRTSSAKKTAAPARTSAGKDKQQSGRDSKTSKPGGSPIKSLPGKDQNPTDVKELTKAKPIAQKPDGISSPHNSVEAQEEASKQIVNPPSSTSGRTDTQAQKISQSAHPPVSKTDPHPSGSIEGTPNGENQLLKSTQLMGLRISTSQSDSPNGQIAAGQIVKNQDPGDGVSVTEISNTEDHAVQGVGTDACSKIVDGEEACDKKIVNRDPAIVPSVDVSIGLDFNFDEYPCSEDDIHELFGSETVRGEARGREASSIKLTGSEEHGAVLNAVMLNTSTDKDTEHAVLTHSYTSHVTEGVSDLSMCEPTSDMVSASRCNPSNRVAESAFSPHTEIRTEQQKNQDQLLSGQNSHKIDQLNQGIFAQQEGQLHSKEKSSLQTKGHSGASAVYPHKEIFSGQHENNDQVLSRQDTRELVQSNQQESPQEGQLHYKEELSLREDEHPGGKNNQGQLSSRQESHQVHQLSQQKLAQKQGRLHSQQESSIQEEAHSGGNHYIIKDIIQHLHLQKNCSFNQIIYYPRSERSIYTNKFIYI
ncbi:VIR protein [Plasmodium vivax]|uniref:VIR protein n=1 Tax=Plasmodium vivax TaxID=5855 RepID=A0A1G4GRN5_PLAVI|nr:VIR protein [Plasmodium vivax]